MSTQYIVKFIDTLFNTEKDAFVELMKGNIPIITVRTHNDKYNNMNETLLYKFMTNNFAEVIFYDTDSYVTLCYKDNNSMNLITSTIKFDNSSASAFTDFKKTFNEMYNTKFETEYYPSGYEMYVGEVLYKKDPLTTFIERIPNGSGTTFYDLPGHMIKYTGEYEAGQYDGQGTFYSMDNKISLKSNNISSGIPIGSGILKFNYNKKRESIIINFNEIWKKYNLMDKSIKKSISREDAFVIDLAKLYWNDTDITIDAAIFNDKSLDDKYFELWNIVRDNGNKLNIIQQYNKELVDKSTALIYKYIMQSTMLIILSIMIVSIL